MIKTLRAGGNTNIRALVDSYMQYISTKEFRLPDGTLARNRPQPNTLWLDDLYMSVPALAQMGKLTGEEKYFNDAVKQIELFSNRMFNKTLNVYMHGWVQEMNVHPVQRIQITVEKFPRYLLVDGHLGVPDQAACAYVLARHVLGGDFARRAAGARAGPRDARCRSRAQCRMPCSVWWIRFKRACCNRWSPVSVTHER